MKWLLRVVAVMALVPGNSFAQISLVWNCGPIIEFDYPNAATAQWVKESKLKSVVAIQTNTRASIDTIGYVHIAWSGDTLIVWDSLSRITTVSKFDLRNRLVSRWTHSGINGNEDVSMYDTLGRVLRSGGNMGDRWRYFDSAGYRRGDRNGELYTYYHGKHGRLDSVCHGLSCCEEKELCSYDLENELRAIVSYSCHSSNRLIDSFYYRGGKKWLRVWMVMDPGQPVDECHHDGISILSKVWYDERGNDTMQWINDCGNAHEQRRSFRYDEQGRITQWPGVVSASWGDHGEPLRREVQNGSVRYYYQYY